MGKKDVKQSDFISTGKKSIFQQVSAWIRGNFFIPDARIFWVKPAVAFLEGFLKAHTIETIITTGPPHSIHLIGLRLKKKNPALKWIADLRDPWSEWDLLDTLALTGMARRRHAMLERSVLNSANGVITIAPYHVRRLEALGGRKVDLITNGFDQDDFKGIKKTKTARFTLAHVGMVDELRDPRPVIEVLRDLCREDLDFSTHLSIKFIGQVNSTFKEYVKSMDELSAAIAFTDYLPHRQLLKLYEETDVQLLILAHTVIAPGNLPGKFFEYLASGNAILALGPVQGDAAEILRQTKAGEIFERADKAGLKASLLRSYGRWKKGETNDLGNIANFTRKNLTAQLVKVLESPG